MVVQDPNSLFASASFMALAVLANLCNIHISARDSLPVFTDVGFGTKSLPSDAMTYLAAWYILLQNLRQPNMTLMSKSTSVTLSHQQ